MNKLLDQIIRIKPKYFFVLFILLHLLIFNINAAEWGDSYRILRASEFIRELSYPGDEKRPPLFSIILAVRPQNVDQVLWGRFVMYLFSLASFAVFYAIVNRLFKKDNLKKNIALLLFVLNPVYLYWSIRIMADIPFSFFVLVAFYILLARFRDSEKLFWSALMGITVGFSVMMRFEGYILFASVFLGIVFLDGFSANFVKLVKKRSSELILYAIFFLLTISSWLYYRNPFTSSYFEEPSNRVYDVNTLIIYLLSGVFLFGFIFSCYFFMQNVDRNIRFFKKNIGISIFVIAEFALILVWPAAIPRLFVPIIPILIIVLSDSIVKYFEKGSVYKKREVDIAILLGLLGIFALGQYIYKLQFLVSIRYLFIVTLIINLTAAYFVINRRFKYFLLVLFLSLIVWSSSSIIVHKDIFRVVKDANIYAVQNLYGRVGYNDVSSVSDWYLNQKNKNDGIEGVYYDAVEKSNRSFEKILSKDLDYILITNEHNTDTTIDLYSWPHLEEIKEFRREINGEIFFTKIIKFNRNI